MAGARESSIDDADSWRFARPEIESVYPDVRRLIAESLACDLDRVAPTSSLVDDLGAESIDFLDILFRLERAFKIKIPQGRLLEDARGAIAAGAFEDEGVLTELGLARVRAILDEVPPDRFPPILKVEAVPRLFTTETFCKMVLRARRQGA